MFLGPAGEAVDRHGQQADRNTREHDLAGALVQDGVDLTRVDGRDECAECGAKSEGDGIAECDAEITDGKAEGKAADAPERAHEDGVANGRARRGGEHVPQVRHQQRRHEERRDDPGGESLHDPIDLKRPALDAAKRDKVGGRGEAADPVIDDAEKGVCTQALPQ